MSKPIYLFAFSALFISACSSEPKEETEVVVETQKYAIPIHSFAQPNKAAVTHLNLDILVDFDSKAISGSATYDVVVNAGENRIVFDTRNLSIKEVTIDGVITKNWWLGPLKEFMGVPLEIEVTDNTKQVSIEYSTTEGAEALQWLNPQQTAGKEHPFLFTQPGYFGKDMDSMSRQSRYSIYL